jgi:hypothetical protein
VQHSEHIVRGFGFRTQRRLVQHQEFARVHFTEILDEREAKAGQPILVGQDEHPHLTRADPIHQGQHLLALKVQTAATCFDLLIDDQSPSSAELLQAVPLLHKIGLLCKTGNATINHTPLLVHGWCQTEHQGQVFIGVGAPIRDRAMRAPVDLRGPIAVTSWEPPPRVWQSHLSYAWT